MGDAVYVLFEEGDNWDGGDQLVGVFSSLPAAMGAVPGRPWRAWSDERQPNGLYVMQEHVTGREPAA